MVVSKYSSKSTGQGCTRAVRLLIVQHASTPGPGAAMYTAPEVFRGEQQSTKMDTFSFGKLLCEVFTTVFLTLVPSLPCCSPWPRTGH